MIKYVFLVLEIKGESNSDKTCFLAWQIKVERDNDEMRF